MEDFEKLGFRCGLEIHQQLLTRQKLFCRCPSGYRNDKPEAEIIRHMRPTLSELGEYDGTALMEFKTKKNVIYQLYRDNCCTYEMDDTPPFPLNREALEIAIKLAMLLNCAVVDELHVSRKQYLDGSIPTGFQRTAIVGVNGWVPYKKRKISITHVCLEEDACREISDIGHDIVFRTDRLSMPLLEVITAPDMRNPLEAMEVNALIGRILKASGLVRRGIGSVRQDVNVSIAGGSRVEIKGVPQTWMVEKLTGIEAARQAELLAIKDALRGRGITDKTIHGEKFDLEDELRPFRIPVIEQALARGWSVRGIKIDGFAGILNWPLQPGMTFADELSGRVKVIACLDKMPNLAVSDIPDMAGFTPEFWRRIREKCMCKHTDAMVITWGPAADVATAISEIKIRAIEATRGVPNETRQAFRGGITGFERILPGPDRMYPDTDSPPIEIDSDFLKRLRRGLSDPAYKVEEKWIKSGVPARIAEKAVVSPMAEIFDRLIVLKIKPDIVWSALSILGVKANEHIRLMNGELEAVFIAYRDRKITKEGLYGIMRSLKDGKVGSIGSEIEKHAIVSITDGKVQDAVEKLIATIDNGRFADVTEKINYISGRIKRQFGSRLDGASLAKEIAKRLQ